MSKIYQYCCEWMRSFRRTKQGSVCIEFGLAPELLGTYPGLDLNLSLNCFNVWFETWCFLNLSEQNQVRNWIQLCVFCIYLIFSRFGFTFWIYLNSSSQDFNWNLNFWETSNLSIKTYLNCSRFRLGFKFSELVWARLWFDFRSEFLWVLKTVWQLPN